MPGSDDTFNSTVFNWLKVEPANQLDNFLDIGAGSGKYGKMVRAWKPDAFISAVECDKVYVNRYHLPDIYDEVYIMDAVKIPDELDIVTGVVFLGDVLEHLRHSDGRDLVEYLLYRCFAMVVVYPHQYVQYGISHPRETHRSIWTEVDFIRYGVLHHKVKDYLHLWILRGMYYNSEAVITPQALRHARSQMKQSSMWEHLSHFKIRII